MNDLNNFIKTKFYDVDIIQVSVPKTGADFEILIEVSIEKTDAQIENMHKDLLEIDLGTDIITINKSKKLKNTKPNLMLNIIL